ncbi:MAG: hypothetical protein IPL86_19280 [Flavobacteriales bacterium]|nr:hypothetical protein [Flavobacteriales bacterium]
MKAKLQRRPPGSSVIVVSEAHARDQVPAVELKTAGLICAAFGDAAQKENTMACPGVTATAFGVSGLQKVLFVRV